MPTSATSSQTGQARIDAVRRFNRFFTRQVGALRKDYLGGPFSLPEARVLYELDRRKDAAASEIAAALEVDRGYLSRVLRQFEKQGLVTRKKSNSDGRRSHISLTARGKRAFAPIDLRSERHATDLLNKLAEPEQKRLVTAMTTIESLSGENIDSERHYILR